MRLKLASVLLRVLPWIMLIPFGLFLESLHNNLSLFSFFVDELGLELKSVRKLKLT
jgi:hypothetical protein